MSPIEIALALLKFFTALAGGLVSTCLILLAFRILTRSEIWRRNRRAAILARKYNDPRRTLSPEENGEVRAFEEAGVLTLVPAIDKRGNTWRMKAHLSEWAVDQALLRDG